MKKTLTAERRNEIAKILLKEGSIKVRDLAKQFNVSTETIRKDIIWLDQEGIAQKSFGGAIAKTSFVENTIDDKQNIHSEEKMLIAKEAIKLIPENGAVILDTGSTNAAIAKELALKSGLTIFTNSLTIGNLLASSDNEVYIMGGRIRKSSRAAIGNWTEQALDSIYADVAFLGSDGFNGLSGPSAVSYSEADFKNKVVKSANKVYTVADSSKFNSSGLFTYANWNDITGLITDNNAPENLVNSIKENTKVILS